MQDLLERGGSTPQINLKNHCQGTKKALAAWSEEKQIHEAEGLATSW